MYSLRWLSALVILCQVFTSLYACVIDESNVQQNFEPVRFSGLWYVTKYNRILQPPGIPGEIMDPQNQKSRFMLDNSGSGIIQNNGQYTIKRRSRVLGTWCMGIDGTVSMDEPAKLQMTLSSPHGRSRGAMSYWILRTDYDNYAVTFTHGYIWELRRQIETNPSVDSGIESLKSDFCINEDLKQSSQTRGTCPINDNFRSGISRARG